MIFKKKSLIVALVSSFVISLVLVLTLVGYLAYIELKQEELKRSYRELFKKINARIYAKHIEISQLEAKIEKTGPLKGKPVIEGTLMNRGTRSIAAILIKVKFLDRDGAAIYEVVFQPHEPSLGISYPVQVQLPYFPGMARTVIKPNELLPFKAILQNCPKEIMVSLGEGAGYAKNSAAWSGTLASDILSVDF